MSLQRKEAALRYRLQMSVFTRTVAGEVAGARTVQWLRGMVEIAGVMLSQKEGDIEGLCRRWAACCAPYK